MKKLLSMLVALLMVFSLAACGEESSSKRRDRDQDDQTTVASTETETGATSTVAPTGTQGTFESELLFEGDGYSVSVTEVNYNTSGYPVSIDISAQNTTTDKEYTIMVREFVIDGLVTSGTCYIEVPAGATVQGRAYVSDYEVEAAALESINGFEAEIYMIDEEYADVASAIFKHGTSAQYSRVIQDTDVVLADESGVKVVLVSESASEGLGYEMIIYIENNASSEIYYSGENGMVNGKDNAMYLGGFLDSKQCTYETISIYEFELEELGLSSFDDIKEIQMDIVVNNWDTLSEMFRKPITITR